MPCATTRTEVLGDVEYTVKIIDFQERLRLHGREGFDDWLRSTGVEAPADSEYETRLDDEGRMVLIPVGGVPETSEGNWERLERDGRNFRRRNEEAAAAQGQGQQPPQGQGQGQQQGAQQ